MYLKQVPLDKRLEMSGRGYCCQPEYFLQIIRSMAEQPIETYLRDNPDALRRLYALLDTDWPEGGPVYREVAAYIAEKMSAVSLLDAKREAICILAIPMLQWYERNMRGKRNG